MYILWKWSSQAAGVFLGLWLGVLFDERSEKWLTWQMLVRKTIHNKRVLLMNCCRSMCITATISVNGTPSERAVNLQRLALFNATEKKKKSHWGPWKTMQDFSVNFQSDFYGWKENALDFIVHKTLARGQLVGFISRSNEGTPKVCRGSLCTRRMWDQWGLLYFQNSTSSYYCHYVCFSALMKELGAPETCYFILVLYHHAKLKRSSA